MKTLITIITIIFLSNCGNPTSCQEPVKVTIEKSILLENVSDIGSRFTTWKTMLVSDPTDTFELVTIYHLNRLDTVDVSFHEYANGFIIWWIDGEDEEYENNFKG